MLLRISLLYKKLPKVSKLERINPPIAQTILSENSMINLSKSGTIFLLGI